MLVCGLLMAATAAKPELAWVSAMQQDGYTVREGVYDFFTIDSCRHIDTCYATNPLTPYGLLYLPTHPNETATEVNYTNSCHKHNLCKTVGNETFSSTWRVSAGETIVVVGLTPPDSTYWSFTNYLYSRYMAPGFIPSPKDFNHAISSCMPVAPWAKEGSRCEIFSGVNDPVNMVSVNASSPFNSSFGLVYSWDARAEATTQSYMKMNVNEMNVQRFPGAVLNNGVSRGDEDEFMVLQRLEGVKDAKAREAFFANPPLRIFRVTPPSPAAAAAAWPTFDGNMRERWTGVTEHGADATSDDIRDGLAALKKILVSRNSVAADDHAVLDFVAFVNDSGYECMKMGLRCMGDCRDTIYARATLIARETECNVTHLPCRPSFNSELSEDPKDSLYVIGVNHQRTHQALYSSLTLYNYPKLAPAMLKPSGAAKKQYALMDEDLAGTAEAYLPGHPAAKYLYVAKLARKCAADDEEYCVEVPASSSNPDDITMTLTDHLVFIERSYMHPGTNSGPDVTETILPTLLHFLPK